MLNLNVFIPIIFCRGWKIISKEEKLVEKKNRQDASGFSVIELPLITYQQKYPAISTRENISQQWIIFIYLLVFYYICRKLISVTCLFKFATNLKILDNKF